jgi:hypothetical protein
MTSFAFLSLANSKLMFLLIKRKFCIYSIVCECVCISNFYEEETLMWWKAQCVCLCHHQKHQQPYENSTDKHDVCMLEKKRTKQTIEDARERVIKRRRKRKVWVSNMRDQSKLLDAALSFVALIEITLKNEERKGEKK